MKTCHFVQRWYERGDSSVSGRRLFKDLCAALEQDRDDVIEFVLKTPSGPVCRFYTKAGNVFYMGVKNGWPATVLTQSMVRRLKDNRKVAKGRNRPHRQN